MKKKTHHIEGATATKRGVMNSELNERRNGRNLTRVKGRVSLEYSIEMTTFGKAILFGMLIPIALNILLSVGGGSIS